MVSQVTFDYLKIVNSFIIIYINDCHICAKNLEILNAAK